MSKKCKLCATKDNLIEVYIEDDVADEEKEFICSACLKQEEEQDNIGFCRCCGSNIAYHVEDLDEKSLCPEHRGEFDLDEEEAQDMEDYIEYNTKDG